MIVIGLTGSIGMGKTTAANMLRDMGLPVHCSDEAVREMTRPGGKAFATVARSFPEAYDKKKNTLDRAKLGEIVFEDPEKKKALEEILHPLVIQSQKDFLRAQALKRCDMAVLDIPLLFETGAERRVDYTIVVTAPEFIQRGRVLSRPGMSEERFDSVIKSQMTDREKCARADYVVQTGDGLASTRKALSRTITDIKSLAQNPKGPHSP